MQKSCFKKEKMNQHLILESEISVTCVVLELNRVALDTNFIFVLVHWIGKHIAEICDDKTNYVPIERNDEDKKLSIFSN